MVKVEVEESDNIDEVLQALEEKTRQSLEEVGQIAVNDARNNTPVRTGNLRNSMTYSIQDGEVIVGSDVDYAVYVEEGTSKQKGQHMVRDAMQDNIDEFRTLIEQNMRE